MLVQRGVKKYHIILTSSSTAEWNFKVLNLQWTKNRNYRLKAARACDLAFIASNLMFLNRCEEADKQRRIARKRKATTVSNSSSACAAVSSTDAVASAVERQEIQESEVDNEGEEAEEYDDGPCNGFSSIS